MVLIPLWLERKHLPTIFSSRKCGVGNKGEGLVCSPARGLLVCLKAEVPENYASFIALKRVFILLFTGL